MARFQVSKDERFPLDKSEGLDNIQIDLKWMSGFDLDAEAFLLGQDGIIIEDSDFVFYNSTTRANLETGEFEPFNIAVHGNKRNWKNNTIPVSGDGSVLGSPDDLGDSEEEGEEAGETMHVILSKVRPEIKEILFCVTIYHGAGEDTTFGKVREPAIIISNEDTGEELCRYDLKEKFSTETAVVAGKLEVNKDGDWEFVAIGQGYDGGLQTLIDLYA